MAASSRAPVAIVMGSDSDLPVMVECVRILESYNVAYDVRVLSAHRSPEAAARFARDAEKRGVKVIVAGAGGAAHLAGAMAAHTVLPVIGVPLDATPLGGLDALLATVQMPPGIPVATVAVGAMGAKNAAHLAVAILAVEDMALREALHRRRGLMASDVLDKSKALPRKLAQLLERS